MTVNEIKIIQPDTSKKRHEIITIAIQGHISPLINHLSSLLPLKEDDRDGEHSQASAIGRPSGQRRVPSRLRSAAPLQKLLPAATLLEDRGRRSTGPTV